MARVPVAGGVKTRLARSVGPVAATHFYRQAAATTLARLGTQPFWRTIIAITPDAEVGTRAWPSSLERRPQEAGDLGRRMHRPMRELPPGPVCIIGTDIPGAAVAQVRAAFRLLGRHDVVFGPAEDGGFWLVGMRRVRGIPYPYAGVRWSTRHALADTLDNLRNADVGFAATLHDVDTVADFARVAGRLGRRILPPAAS